MIIIKNFLFFNTRALKCNIYMARNFYWEMVFSSTLSENRPVIKNPFQFFFDG